MELHSIGFVNNQIPSDGHPGFRHMESVIILSDTFDENAFEDLQFFSHLEVIFYLTIRGNQHPEHGTNPLDTGVDSQKGRLFGTSIVKLIRKEGRVFTVLGLDACNGTAVIDIKPVMGEFMPKEDAVQPTSGRKPDKH